MKTNVEEFTEWLEDLENTLAGARDGRQCPRCGSPCQKRLIDDDGHYDWSCIACTYTEMNGSIALELLGWLAFFALFFFIYCLI